MLRDFTRQWARNALENRRRIAASCSTANNSNALKYVCTPNKQVMLLLQWRQNVMCAWVVLCTHLSGDATTTKEPQVS